VSFAGGPPGQVRNEIDGPLDVIDRHFKMGADLPRIGSGTTTNYMCGSPQPGGKGKGRVVRRGFEKRSFRK